MNPIQDTKRSALSLWRWLLVIIGVNVLLIVVGFLVPATDDGIYVAAVQHLLVSDESIGRRLRPTVAYVRSEEAVSPEARETLLAYAPYVNVRLRWLTDEASMALEAERSIDNGGYLFSLGAPRHGVIFSSIDAETHVTSGSKRSELVFLHWMGVSEVWQERQAQ